MVRASILLALAVPAASVWSPVGAQQRPGTPNPLCNVSIAKELPPAYVGQPYRQAVVSGRAKGPTITNAPPGLVSVGGWFLQGTPTRAGKFTVTVTTGVLYISECVDLTDMPPLTGQVIVTVLEDTQAPTIAAFTVSRDTLPALGGDVVVTVQASDNLAVAQVLSSRTHPDGTGNSGILKLVSGNSLSGTWTMTWPLPANGGTSPLVYTLKAWVLDASKNETRAAPRMVIVRGKSSTPPVLRR